jgi:murein DD-endopeptidase MepM/ murein hydrolase activator NlpD
VKVIHYLLGSMFTLAGGALNAQTPAKFLQFPLRCSDAACTINYSEQGAYTANSISSVLDHRMLLNSTNYYPYGRKSNAGGNQIIVAFNGEAVSGAAKSGDDRCIGGTIYIRPDYNRSLRMTNDGGCGAGYTSYDEHPGYDYRAAKGTPVYAAAGGTVISTVCYLGNAGSGSCASWGALAINHGNGYFSQYMHMDTTIAVVAGQKIAAGAQIGTVGGRCGTDCSLAPHLHFEVRHIGPAIGAEAYPVVDPYGWVGGGTDPLYSASRVAPANLWK